MGKALAKSYMYSIVASVIGVILLLISSAGSSGESQEQMENESWRMGLAFTGIAIIFLATVGRGILHLIFEYKVLKS